MENNTTQITVGEVRQLLQQGKKVKVKTLNGDFTQITDFIDKGLLPTFLVTLENGNSIKVTADHRFFSSTGWLRTKEIVLGKTQLLCDDGNYSLVSSIKEIGEHKIVDITVEHPEHCYFGNGILNHNTGKSYMAAQIAVNAQKMGITPVYLDSESSISPEFLEKMGCDLDNFLYVQAVSVEKTLELIEDLLKTGDQQFLFIWDSMALTPTVSDIEGDFNPQSSMAVKPRILSKGLSKLIIPIAQSQSTLLILNQLKLNIGAEGNPKYLTQSQKFFTPGGKALAYAYSLRIWLTGSKSKDSFVYDDKGYRVGSLVKARLEKSRFGSQGRSCEFKILWGDDIGVLDDESLFEALKGSPYLATGAWNTLSYADGTEEKFRSVEWVEKMKDDKFRNRIMELIDDEIVRKFDDRTGEASEFYDTEEKPAGFLEEF